MCELFLPQFVAHTPNEKKQWHLLKEHLECVAIMAESFANKFQAGKLGYYAGLWHDIGKISPTFQNYLKACYLAELNKTDVPVKGGDHKTFGSVFATQQGQFHKSLSVLAFPIQGHHGGLPSQIKLREKLQEKQKLPEVKTVFNSAQIAIKNLFPEEEITVPRIAEFTPTEAEFFIRMLFSCLVDADFLDTERHFQEEKTEKRKSDVSLHDLWKNLEAAQGKISGQSQDQVSQLRHEVYLNCLQAAELPQGIFRLSVPTGGGKTRSSLAFALKHALKHQLDRVIMAIPYTSIIEQTTDVYRDILGVEAVLEHHSSVRYGEDEHNPSEQEIKARLASENWDVPLVVTTTVQFFESLFAHKTSKCRKLHNIARSVVILDEVQTLPTKLLEPILDVLTQLVKHYQVTVVLCTATQPAMEYFPHFQQLSAITEIVPEPRSLFQMLKRVDFSIDLERPLSWPEVAERLQQETQVLCILNTKKDALALLECLPREQTLHLSTLLCGAHRRDVLKEVKQRLKNNEPCLLVATQVVEAGVDLDFPTVFRALGPLDRIVQAAGRCNREGKMTQPGKVFVFEPLEGKMPPGDYQAGTDNARVLLRQGTWDLNLPDVFERYFRSLYQSVNTDAKKIQLLRKNFDYPEVSFNFRIISDDSVSVVVKYDKEKVEKLLVQLQEPWRYPKTILRKLQPYIVNIRKNELRKHQQENMLREIIPGIWEWLGKYDELCGLMPEMMNPEDLVI